MSTLTYPYYVAVKINAGQLVIAQVIEFLGNLPSENPESDCPFRKFSQNFFRKILERKGGILSPFFGTS